MAYDAVNRLETTTYGDASPPVTRHYTDDGLLETITSDNSTWTTTYNNRRLSTGETLTLDSVNYPIGYTYTANGHVASLRYPDDSVVDYAPNALGEATKVGNYASGITTHPDGALAGFTYGNGIVHTTEQNTRGLPSRSKDGAVLDDSVTYDDNANVASIVDNLANAESDYTRTMEYDALDRLTQATNQRDWGGTQIYDYDPLDNLRRSRAGAQDWTHVYNAATHRLDRLDTTGGGALISYGYDARGRVTSRSPQTFTVDLADRVRSIGPGVASYRYDGHGRRTSVTKAGTTTVQVYSQSGQLLYQRAPIVGDGIFRDNFDQKNPYPAATGGGTRYVYLGRHLIAEDNIGGRRYHHTDGLGSPVVEMTTNGTKLGRVLYRPYGWGPPSASKPGFTGHVGDTESGLSYMQARYYDPYAGRFLAADPVEASVASFNRYWYTNNNPYKFIDPDGRWVCSSGDCGKFREGLEIVRSASTSERLTESERKVLAAVVALYGKEDGSGVKVFIRDDLSTTGQATRWDDGTIAIYFRPAIRQIDNAKIITHEGQHGLDDKNRDRPKKNIQERKETELNAYTAQAYFQKAMNYVMTLADGWTPDKGIQPANIDKLAQDSVLTACKNSRDGSCGSGE